MTWVPTTVARILERPLAERPDAPAVVARTGTLTYRQLDAAADRAAGALVGLGLRQGDRVAASLPNDLDVIVAFHGALRAGGVWVGINGALAAVEKAHLLADSRACLLLGDRATAAQLVDLRDTLPALREVVVVEPGHEQDRWRGLLAAAPAYQAPDLDPGSPAGIAYTSGTTGLPRGVLHSHRNLLLPGAVIVADRGYGSSLRKGDCLPLTVLNLMVLTTLLTAQAGGCCVVMDRRDAPGIVEWIRAHKVTVWNGVPAQLHDLVRLSQAAPGGALVGRDLVSLREVWSGGADCPAGVREAFERIFGLPLRVTYGLTEVPTVVAMDPVGTDWQPGASGRPLPHLQVRVLDDDGDEVGPEILGEICVSAIPDGPWAGCWTPMLGEWCEGTLVPPAAGPLRTGDLGTLDRQGWLRILDRRKLVVVRGGANVYPAEVERVLEGLPGVAAAAVFGLPDDRLGQRVAALVQPIAGSQPAISELAESCRAALARYKVPERWALVDVLPRNAMGKVVRSALPALLKAYADRP